MLKNAFTKILCLHCGGCMKMNKDNYTHVKFSDLSVKTYKIISRESLKCLFKTCSIYIDESFSHKNLEHNR